MTWLFHLLVALVVVGDYLMLSVSRVTLGTNANWLLFVGLLQVAAVVMAIGLGKARGLRMNIPLLGFAGLGLTMLLHTANRTITTGEIGGYGTVKMLSFFALSGPAFLLGSILGLHKRMPGRELFGWLIAPLLLICAVALLTDPSAMTIRPSAELVVFFGVLVMPVHQALAFSLGKAALWLQTTLSVRDGNDAERGVPRIVLLAAVGFCLAMAVFSGSRGYLVAAGVALLAQWASGRSRPGVLILAAGVPFALFVWLADDTIRGGLDPATFMSSASMFERMDLFAAAFEAFWESPIFGHGPGGFAMYYGYLERVYPHNMFLEVLSELGLVGAAFLAMVLVPVILRAVRAGLRRDLDEVQFFALGFLVFALVGAMGVADLIRNHFLFLAAGMTAVSCAPVPEPAKHRARRAARTPHRDSRRKSHPVTAT